MSLNPKFRPIEDFYKSEQKTLSTPGLPVQPFNNDAASMVIPTAPGVLPLTQSPDKAPGFFSSLGHAFLEYNEFAQLGRFVSRQLQFAHPSNDPVPDDFDPYSEEYLRGFPPNYHDWLTDAQSPKDMAARQQYVLEQMNEKERFNNGSLAGSLIGGFFGGGLSPSSLIPFAASVKYASLGQNVIRNIIQSSPAIAVQTLAHEGFMQATDAGGNLEDLTVNALRDSAFGAAFVGLGAGLGSAYRGGKLWNVRKTADYNYQGIDFNYEINPETSQLTGEIKATAAPGFSVNAAKVEQAQQFADSAAHEGFIFGLPGVSKIAGNSVIGSPIVKGLTHTFDTVKSFTDRLASHSILTKGVMRGKVRPDSAEDIFASINAGAVNFGLVYRTHFYEENGIIGGYNVRNAARALKQRALKGEKTSWGDFNYKTIDSVLTQEYNYSKAINAASKLYTGYTDSLYKELQEMRGFHEEILSPFNARGYFTQNLDPLVLVKDKKRFNDVVVDVFKKQDEVLAEAMRPVEEATRFLKQLEDFKLSGEALDRSAVTEIKQARARLDAANRELERRARDDETVAILLEDRNFVSMENAEKIRELHAPIKEVEVELSKKKKEISKLKKSYSSAKSSAKSTVTKEATLRNIAKMKDLESRIKLLEKEAKTLDDQIVKLTDELHERAHKGEIDSRLFTRDQNVITFRNPDEWARLRKPFANDNERLAAAEAQRNLYINSTPEQIQQALMGSMMPSLFANPLKRRVFPIPAKILNDNGFLMADVPQSAAIYARSLGRHIALAKVFKDVNMLEGEAGPIGMARILSEEKAKKESVIDKNPKLDEKQKARERLKLDKKFRDATDFMKNMMNVFMGNYNASAKALRISRAIKNFAASTKLGGVPIAQVTDLGAIVLKHGLWPFLRDGLKPMIQTMNGYVGGELGEIHRRNAADCHLSLEHMNAGYSAKYSDSLSVGEVPIATHLESALEKLAHLSGNFYGTNYVENGSQRLVAGIMQSRIMRNMYEYKNGTLSKTDEIGLLQYGLDPKIWADRFIKSFEGATGWKTKTGAFQSKYWEWSDFEAVGRMAMTIRRGVKDTIVQRGLFTSPFWTNNPIASTVLMFHGWGFAAFNKYTIPMLQRPDASKVQGIIMMLSIGAMIDPMRQFANGTEADVTNDDVWFAKAFESVANSGLMGHTPDFLQTMDKFLNGTILPRRTEKFKSWNKFSVLGPAAGITQDIATLFEHLVSPDKQITTNDVKKGLRIAPLSGHILTRRLLNEAAESMGLPETP